MNIGTAVLPRIGGEATFLAPTRTFVDKLDITIAGVAMQLVHVPSEASDEIAVFLPQSGILLSAEVIPAQTFPVLDTLRGERFRDPVGWYESIDRLRGFKATAMVPAHGLPVIGAENVEQVLLNFRDAIQYVHDQTVRHMNKGLTPDQLVDVIRLPPHLEKFTLQKTPSARCSSPLYVGDPCQDEWPLRSSLRGAEFPLGPERQESHRIPASD
jgi:alkyl sulfatase BDS1-like metallo-beta-lactamase superfamily hydrolase